MPAAKQLVLSEEQRKELAAWTKNPPKPYLRRKAWALLLVGRGKAAYETAQDRRVHANRVTVSAWLEKFQAHGLEGLKQAQGQGRKPGFFPQPKSEVQAAVASLLHSSPRKYGIQRTRWRLQDVRCALSWLQGYSEAGIYKVLKRLGFSRKQAINFIHSPDPNYRAKWQAVLRAYSEVVAHPGAVLLLFMDELTYYRRPSKAPAYHQTGATQPQAREVAGPNTQTRLVAVLNALTGQVTYLQRSKIGAEALALFYAHIRSTYPDVTKIYLAQDNWPVHKLDLVYQALQRHRLSPLFLPTYASWLNPIEKLWRWLKQEVLHLHRLASQFQELRQHVLAFLDQFKNGSDDLLRYVGILSE